jgi:spore germination protein (amino acid permease)
MKNKEFVTSYGLFSTIVVTVVGIGIFSYPRELANIVGTDAWLITLVLGLVTFFIMKIIWKVEKINNFSEFNVLVRSSLGNMFGNILLIGFAISQLLSISIGMRSFVEVIKMYLLEKTPTEFLIIVTIFCGTYLIRGEMRSLIKFNEIALWVMFVPIIFVLIFLLNMGDFTNIFPILHTPPIQYVKVMKYTAFSFGGFEIAYLVIPFLKDKKEGFKVITKSIAFIVVFYTVITIMVFAVFSKEQVRILIWPTITMIRSLDIPGTFIERWDGIVLALWIIFYLTTFVNGYYFSSQILKEAFKLEDIKVSSLLIVPFIYIIAMYPKDIGEVFYLGNTIMPILFIYNLIFLPLLLYMGSMSKRHRKESVK